MELIKIPQVSLVDASGKSIGVYTDDPDWWQQLKMKQQHHAQILQHTMNKEAAAVSTRDRNGGIKQLMSNLKKQPTVQTHHMHDNTNEKLTQCNVIGETPLHIAIIYNDLSTIKFLIEHRGYLVNQRSVVGRFQAGFSNKDALKAINGSQYERLAYFGEYPLAFAACFASKDVYDYLLSKGADPNLQDSYGNTVLHILIINNRLDMFKYVIKHATKKADLTIKNNQNLTPLNLAAKLGRENLFTEMLELRNVEFWRYRDITCSAFPLDGLDTIGADGKIAWNAALNFIINGDTNDHLEMIKSGVVKRLLADKWNTYGQRRFFKRLVVALMHLLFLSIAVYCRKADYDNLAIWPPPTPTTWVRYICEVCVVLNCVSNVYLQIKEIYVQGFMYFIKNLEPAKFIYLLSCILILILVPFRFVSFSTEHDHEQLLTPRSIEYMILIIAVPCSWLYLLFFFKVASITGPFVVMIYKMIAGDILTFAYIYVIALFGFTLSFFYLYKNAAIEVTTFDYVFDALIMSFQMSMGEIKDRVPELDELEYSTFTKIVFVGFMVLVHILLLNMLIAMMGNTYRKIIEKSEREWRRQWANVLLLLEHTFTAKELKKFQEMYSIKLPNPQGGEKDILGLMVIKKTLKTKAFQRKSAISNWKRVVRAVMKLLKERKCLPSELFPRSESPIFFHKNQQRSANILSHQYSEQFKTIELIDNSILTTSTTVNSASPTTSLKHQSNRNINSSNSKKIILSPNNGFNKVYPLNSAPSLSTIDNLINDIMTDGTEQKNNDMTYIKNEELPKISKKKTIFTQRKNSITGSNTNLLQQEMTDSKESLQKY